MQLVTASNTVYSVFFIKQSCLKLVLIMNNNRTDKTLIQLKYFCYQSEDKYLRVREIKVAILNIYNSTEIVLSLHNFENKL